MEKKYKLVIECEEFCVADSLHELGSEIECTDVLDTMKYGTLQINGDHYDAAITDLTVRNNIRQIEDLFNNLTSEEKVSLMTSMYTSMYDSEKDEFLRETENA